MAQKQRRNGSGSQFGVPDKKSSPAASMESLADTAVDADLPDEFLDQANLGLGNYTDAEMWQQVRSYGHAMYAETFSRLILERAIYETKLGLAEHGWQARDEDGNEVYRLAPADEEEMREDETRREFIQRRGQEKWKRLDERERVEAIEEFSGITESWTSPFHRMMLVRHETSRSRDARLIDNLFGRVRKLVNREEDNSSRSFLSRGGDS
jgi:hypothetical protein